MTYRMAGIPAALVLISAAPALASGFAFYEQSAKASGQAGAWVARADDAAANWYDPAALVHLKGFEIQFGANYLDIGSDTSLTLNSGTKIDAVGNVATPFHLYFAQKIGSRVAWGIGINTPFGLITEWNDPPVTFSSRKAELRTYLVNPNAAFAVNDNWSIGLGVDYLSAEVRSFSRDAVIPVLGPTTSDLTGEGDAWGYNVGFQFKRECFAIAGQYRSELTPVIDGTLTFSGPPGNFLNSTASAKVHLPGQFLMGAAWTGKRADVEFAAYYTQWNMFKNLEVETPNPATSVNLREDWSPTWSYRLGAAFRFGATMAHEVRVGAYLDDAPIPPDTLRPSIPDGDRTGYTLGYGYLANTWGVDVYAMQLDFDDTVANGSPAEGVINGTYKSSILLLGGTFKYRF